MTSLAWSDLLSPCEMPSLAWRDGLSTRETATKKKDFTQPSRREKKLSAILDGIVNKFPAGDSIRIDGILLTKADFQAKVQGCLSPETAARLGHVNQLALTKAKKANAKPADELIVAATRALVSYYGSADDTDLSAYGITPPRKRTKATGAQSVIKAAKAQGTRAARGTLGSRQKASIQGGTPAQVTVQGTAVPTFKAPKGGSQPT
ncbi:MAG TPA: hypothetical protein VFF73_21730 [Planctomycetota bacterium]|nr:hypothetical protein [Planctomycetota bacterium]